MRMLGFWVLNTALRQGKKWLDESTDVAMLTVNLSNIEARAPTLEHDVAAALWATGFPPDRLELDITEQTFLEITRRESHLFANLRRMGVHFSIDDFGKGYSSLKHLRLFPIDRLKIAGEFVKNTDRDRDNAAIVEAVLTLARSLGHRVVAEGVETAVDADFLRARGCEAGQGYYLARPMPAPDMELLLRKQMIAPVRAGRPAEAIQVEKLPPDPAATPGTRPAPAITEEKKRLNPTAAVRRE